MKRKKKDKKLKIDFRQDVIMFHVGPETPKLNGLLKTTCSDEDYDDIDDFDTNVTLFFLNSQIQFENEFNFILKMLCVRFIIGNM